MVSVVYTGDCELAVVSPVSSDVVGSVLDTSANNVVVNLHPGFASETDVGVPDKIADPNTCGHP